METRNFFYNQLPVDLELIHLENNLEFEIKCALIEPSYINVIVNQILMRNFYFKLENRDAYKKLIIDNDNGIFTIER